MVGKNRGGHKKGARVPYLTPRGEGLGDFLPGGTLKKGGWNTEKGGWNSSGTVAEQSEVVQRHRWNSGTLKSVQQTFL